jgi:DNA-binding Lrp family transcriptional regulator
LRRVTLLDRKKLGLSLTVILNIGMDRHTPDRFEQFEAAVAALPEVQECYLVTGQEADYQLKVVVPDMDAYQAFLLGKITRIPGVSGRAFQLCTASRDRHHRGAARVSVSGMCTGVAAGEGRPRHDGCQQ